MNGRPRLMMISTHGYVAAAPEFGKPDTGGQVVYVLELSKQLARLGYDVDIFTRRFEDQPAEEPVAEGVRILRFPCGGDAFIPKETLDVHIPEWVGNVLEYMAANRAEYRYINSHYWDAGIAGELLADRLQLPHVHTPHSLGAWKRDNMDGDPAELERRFNFRHRIEEELQIYTDCDALVATTPQQRDLLAAGQYRQPPSKIHVIPPGYDDTRFYPVSPATRQAIKQDLDAEGPIVLALGRMASNKGYDLLIRAMKPIVRRVPEARLLLAVGSTTLTPSETEQLQELRVLARELGIYDRVLLRDHIPDEVLADYYRAADVFALSSRYEPFGMTAVEAMACGTPAVVTTEGGLWRQVVWGAEALYANPFDPDAFGHAVATVLQYPEVADRLSQHGAIKTRGVFTWTAVAQQVLQLLESAHHPPQREIAAAGDPNPKASRDELQAVVGI